MAKTEEENALQRKTIHAIRFDERTWMRLNEVAEIYDVGVSVVIRTLLTKALDDMEDEDGYIKRKNEYMNSVDT